MDMSWLHAMGTLLTDSTEVCPFLIYMLPVIDGLFDTLGYGDDLVSRVTLWKYAVFCR